MGLLLGLMVGVGLAASCGLRVFAPLLIMGIASASGHLTLGEGFQWIGSPITLLALGVATALEIGARNIPYIDHLLDIIAAPAAAIAGTLVMAACVQDMSPFLTWSLALIAGGGTAAVVKGGAALVRVVSTGTTGGLGNSALAATETGAAVFIAVFSIVLPLLVFVILIGFTWFAVSRLRRWHRRREARSTTASSIAV